MSMIYLVALVGVGIALLLATVEAVLSVSRRPKWSQPVFAKSSFHLVETVDRRQSQLPFVGKDRRDSAATEAESEVPLKRAA